MILQAFIFLGVAVFAAGDEIHAPLQGTVNSLGVNWGPYEVAKTCSYSSSCEANCQVDGGCCPDGHHYVSRGQYKCCRSCPRGSECPTYQKYTCADTPCVPCICNRYDGDKYFECTVKPHHESTCSHSMCKLCKEDGRWAPNHECTSSVSGNEVEVTVGPSHTNYKWVEVPSGVTCPNVVDKENWLGGYEYGDEFSVRVETWMGGTTKIKVTRTDADHGWGMNLKFKCKKGPEAAISSA